MARPRKTETRQSITIRLEPSMLAELDRRVEERGTTRTKVIEEAIAQLGATPDSALETPSPPRRRARMDNLEAPPAKAAWLTLDRRPINLDVPTFFKQGKGK